MTLLTEAVLVLCASITDRALVPDPEEVEAALLQFCSSQLKLLQLYVDVQHLHSAAAAEAPVNSNQVWFTALT